MNTIEQNKMLCERYPFLLPRNLWTDEVNEDYDYSYIRGIEELPIGWRKLFLQMCEDIRQPLIDADYLDKFRFSQIKEKYNRMCCYNFGAPEHVYDIIMKYEYISQFICQRCGKPATYETTGWYTSYCDECIEDVCKKHAVPIEFNPVYRDERYQDSKKTIIETDVSDIWNRLYK